MIVPSSSTHAVKYSGVPNTSSNLPDPLPGTSPVEQARLFLECVWQAMPADSLLGLSAETCYFHRPTSSWKSTVTPNWLWKEQIDSSFYDWAQEQNNHAWALPGLGGVYWQTASRKASVLQRYGARGSLDELMLVTSLYCDLDVAKHGYSLTDALAALLGMPLKPTIVVFTGGGLQAIHVLKPGEGWPVINREASAEYKAYSLAFYREIYQSTGLELDRSVHEASRMLRLPGTVNRKPERGGALARLVHYDPDRLYSMRQIKDAAEPHLVEMQEQSATRAKLFAPLQGLDLLPNRSGIYQVSQDFVHYLVDHEVQPPERHPVILRLAMQASRAGIPQDDFVARMRPVARKWYSEAPDHEQRAGDELGKVIAWAYSNAQESLPDTLSLLDLPANTGNWAVKLSEDLEQGFELASEAAQDVLRDRTIKLPINPQLPEASASKELLEQKSPEIPNTQLLETEQFELLTVQELRTQQSTELHDYVETVIRPRGLGTYFLLRTPPGVGKTHLAVQVGLEYALRKGVKVVKSDLAEVGSDPESETKPGRPLDSTQALDDKAQAQQLKGRGKVAVLTMFQLEEHGWRDWLKSFGFDASALKRCMYLVSRNEDPNSAGYCAMKAIVDAVAAKGHNAVAMVCKRCPVAAQCEQSWYLSQFKKAQKKDIVLARHQHGVIDQLLEYRRLLIFDESPLSVVSGMLQLEIRDLVFNPPVFARDQYEEAMQLIGSLLGALQRILGENNPVPQSEKDARPAYPTMEHVRLGGRWLMDNLVERLGEQTLDRISHLSGEVVRSAGQPGSFALSIEGVQNLPYNYLFDLWEIVSYEYQKHYLAGRARWNSRLIPWGQALRIYPMRPFQFDSLTKVIVCDATGQPDLYAKAFADKVTLKARGDRKPRQGYVFEERLIPHAHVVQWTNSGNSRRALLHKKKSRKPVPDPITVETADGLQHSIQPEDPEQESAALERAKEQIKFLAKRHDKSLLVVSYQAIHSKLKIWAIKTKTLPDSYIQYYGNLRGRNDFKSLQAVLLIGEPRIPPMEVFAAAQVWYFDDDIPIDTKLYYNQAKTENGAYPSRLEPYPGYVDPVDGQGRAYAYPGYLDDRLNRVFLWSLQSEMRQCLERIRANAPALDETTGKPQPRYVYIAAQMPCTDHVDELGSWSEWYLDQAGEDVFKDLIGKGKAVAQTEFSQAMHKAGYAGDWHTHKKAFERIHARLHRQGLVKTAYVKKTQLDLAIEWKTDPSHPERTKMTPWEAHRENAEISLRTFQRAEKVLNPVAVHMQDRNHI